ncbi:Ldh family oxidoreductase [Paraburkholderia sp. MM5384-R2]|uniref:Ldh family oxidoreductase n=1 Tax=Paraburkholderia sp. MM5384-R2 TaxID=2723097 RepID=UPI00160E6707|nr:Ldh family oxidoreductase [Paraburkholderia sp. MM5384-R2]MBB5498816.1 LDH2 family malate/lactate/ureidoglycolate dehydrogenase [Paraburkholderia sp. MM5384-R2]
MQISHADAHDLAVRFLVRHEMPEPHARMVADHLVYAAKAGHTFAGLPRLLPIAERLRKSGTGGEIRTLKETDKSALIDGANVNGYVTSVLGMDKAIELARRSGVGIVGVNNSWFSGLLRFYVERAADSGLIGIHAANSTATVAPLGGADKLMGTNPLAFAFPSVNAPLVIDFATASVMWGDVIYHGQLGKPLADGCALDHGGRPTTDPAQALAGAILGWGGARGFSVAMIVQALGILAGSDPVIGDAGKWGYLFIAIDPGLLLSLDTFRERIGELTAAIERSRPVPGGETVRVPGSATQLRIDTANGRGWIELDEAIYRCIDDASR